MGFGGVGEQGRHGDDGAVARCLYPFGGRGRGRGRGREGMSKEEISRTVVGLLGC